MQRNSYILLLTALALVLIASALFSLHLGTIRVPFAATFSGFNAESCAVTNDVMQTWQAVITQIRLPRILAAVLCGAALAVSGAAFQSMFLNPLVSPDLLGVLAGSAFGASLGLLFGKSLAAAHFAAFLAGMSAVFLAVSIAGLFQGNRLIMLIMGGVISSSLFTSLLSIVKFVADPHNQLPEIVHWLMGGFSSVTPAMVAMTAPLLTGGIIAITAMSGYLNVLSMGDEEASALGIRVSLVRNLLIVITTLVCSITVAAGGMVGWVGLMIPHIARMITGPDNRQLVPVAALIGGIYLLLTDDLCRAIFSSEIPIGIMTSMMGVPFFILVLSRTSGRWN